MQRRLKGAIIKLKRALEDEEPIVCVYATSALKRISDAAWMNL